MRVRLLIVMVGAMYCFGTANGVVHSKDATDVAIEEWLIESQKVG